MALTHDELNDFVLKLAERVDELERRQTIDESNLTVVCVNRIPDLDDKISDLARRMDSAGLPALKNPAAGNRKLKTSRG